MNNTTSAFIGVVGRPNVGKSTFINFAVGQKISIVSDKPQTTRTKIMGVVTTGEKQLVFIDTPGFHKPHNQLGNSMMKAVSNGLNDVDAVLFIVEAVTNFKNDDDNLPAAEQELLNNIKKRKIKTILGINKIDLLQNKEDLFNIITKYCSKHDFEAVVPFSAKSGDGVDLIIKEAEKFLKPSPHYFGDGEFTDQPDEVLIAEIIREKLLRRLDKEVPHGIAVDIERFYERDNAGGDPILEIEASVFCERDSHKGIIIGKNGNLLKKIGTEARREIEEIFATKTNIKLWVKVKEDWRNRTGIIHAFGLD